jgi:Cu/Ag efflux pump CusA
MACTLIGGTAAGTVVTLLFLPALYAIWFRVRKPASNSHVNSTTRDLLAQP